MRHTFFAKFEDDPAAAGAVRAIEALPTGVDGAPEYHMVMHRGALDAENLSGGETRVRAMALDNSLIGAVAGGIVGGLVLGPLGMATAAAAAWVGGALTGAIGGASLPDRKLEQMARGLKAGQVILTVESRGLTQRDRAEAIARGFGGRVEHRTIF